MDTNSLEHIDVEAIKSYHENNRSRSIKRQYVKQGYNKMMSLYGAQHNDEKQTTEGIRIEILSNTNYDEKLVYGLYDFFKDLKVLEIYSIWIYDIWDDSLKLIWDGKTTFDRE
jgi:hypothetical protein